MSERTRYSGNIFEIVEFETGDGRIFEVARRSPGVRLIITDKMNKKVLLAKEYRHEFGEWDYRLPGGKIFDSLDEYEEYRQNGDNVEEAAQNKAINEAGQEAGVELTDLKLFKKSILGTTVEWDLYVFETDNWQFSVDGQELEVDEKIEADNWYGYDELWTMILNGSMQEERVALVLLQWLEAKR